MKKLLTVLIIISALSCMLLTSCKGDDSSIDTSDNTTASGETDTSVETTTHNWSDFH